MQSRLKLRCLVLHYPPEKTKMKCRVAITDKLSWKGAKKIECTVGLRGCGDIKASWEKMSPLSMICSSYR